MRPRVRRLASAAISMIAAALLVLSGSGVAHAALTPKQLRTVTDQYLFEYTLASFTATRAQQPYADQLDWSSDACSWSPDAPLGYDFTTSCNRHDFGYRNYKLQSRFTEENRLRIDDRFREDMYSSCGGNPLCRGVANIYYSAVRQFGGSSSSTAEALSRANVDERVENYVRAHLAAHATR
ncbi:phospholipase [Actinorugispora endophytica]|uniref:Phospholipase A2-like protein n=1 Tax=Actinorugispora endophytica TaxID=1605990 RepID=A0A4R6V1H0_9ACTN|nr:phospholipase [Actinorugispora endophytica]TDQ53723.1 phospholipase A2-like protein [Actinorugispora endophytica]